MEEETLRSLFWSAKLNKERARKKPRLVVFYEAAPQFIQDDKLLSIRNAYQSFDKTDYKYRYECCLANIPKPLPMVRVYDGDEDEDFTEEDVRYLMHYEYQENDGWEKALNYTKTSTISDKSVSLFCFLYNELQKEPIPSVAPLAVKDTYFDNNAKTIFGTDNYKAFLEKKQLTLTAAKTEFDDLNKKVFKNNEKLSIITRQERAPPNFYNQNRREGNYEEEEERDIKDRTFSNTDLEHNIDLFEFITQKLQVDTEYGKRIGGIIKSIKEMKEINELEKKAERSYQLNVADVYELQRKKWIEDNKKQQENKELLFAKVRNYFSTVKKPCVCLHYPKPPPPIIKLPTLPPTVTTKGLSGVYSAVVIDKAGKVQQRNVTIGVYPEGAAPHAWVKGDGDEYYNLYRSEGANALLVKYNIAVLQAAFDYQKELSRAIMKIRDVSYPTDNEVIPEAVDKTQVWVNNDFRYFSAIPNTNEGIDTKKTKEQIENEIINAINKFFKDEKIEKWVTKYKALLLKKDNKEVVIDNNDLYKKTLPDANPFTEALKTCGIVCRVNDTTPIIQNHLLLLVEIIQMEVIRYSIEDNKNTTEYLKQWLDLLNNQVELIKKGQKEEEERKKQEIEEKKALAKKQQDLDINIASFTRTLNSIQNQMAVTKDFRKSIETFKNEMTNTNGYKADEVKNLIEQADNIVNRNDEIISIVTNAFMEDPLTEESETQLTELLINPWVSRENKKHIMAFLNVDTKYVTQLKNKSVEQTIEKINILLANYSNNPDDKLNWDAHKKLTGFYNMLPAGPKKEETQKVINDWGRVITDGDLARFSKYLQTNKNISLDTANYNILENKVQKYGNDATKELFASLKNRIVISDRINISNETSSGVTPFGGALSPQITNFVNAVRNAISPGVNIVRGGFGVLSETVRQTLDTQEPNDLEKQKKNN
jgi:hypothetical protein